MWTFLLGTIIFVSTLAWAQNRKKDAPKIVGIYSQPGKWYYLKYVAFRLLLKTRRYFRRAKGGGLGQGLGDIAKWDQPQQLSEDEKAFDAVFFQGAAQDGYYLASGIERRQRGKANALIYLMVRLVTLLLKRESTVFYMILRSTLL